MRQTHYTSRFQFRVTTPMREAIEREAAREQCSDDDMARRLLASALLARGANMEQAPK